MGFEPMNVTLRGLCVRPLHQQAIKQVYCIIYFFNTQLNLQNLFKTFIMILVIYMKKYGDLRDYHNYEFNYNNFVMSSNSCIALFIYSTLMKINPICAIIYLFPSLFQVVKFKFYLNSYFNKIDKRSLLLKRKKIYNQVLDVLCNFIKKNNITDPIGIMNLLSNIIKNGNLSYKHNFTFDNVLIEPLELSSYQVLIGCGVCRNVNQLATDVFKKLGYNAYDIFCTDVSNLFAVSHLITLVEYNNNSYYLDVSNNVNYDCKDFYLSSNGENEFIIVNVFSSNFSKIDPKTIVILCDYYKNKRSYKELKRCFFDTLPNSISSNIESINLNTKEVYYKNRKLYRKFKDTYL